ncbi:hypothetical protein pb186bvf_015832 [Paramecium bursaria]
MSGHRNEKQLFIYFFLLKRSYQTNPMKNNGIIKQGQYNNMPQ